MQTENSEDNDKYKAPYTLSNVAGFWTAEYNTSEGSASAIILPASTKPSESWTKVHIDLESGVITLPSKYVLLTEPAMEECCSETYRSMAEANLRTLAELSHAPGIFFGAEYELKAWAEECCNSLLRFFMGGDVCCTGLMQCASNVAKAVPGKRFLATSCNADVLNDMFTWSAEGNLPDNFMLFMEQPMADKMCFACLPVCKHSETAGDACGDFGWWPAEYESCILKTTPRAAREKARILAR